MNELPTPSRLVQPRRIIFGKQLTHAVACVLPCIALIWVSGCNDDNGAPLASSDLPSDDFALLSAHALHPPDGQQVFRYETFGDEQFWRDTLRMHEVIQTAVSPATALAVGLKVDAEALPAGFLAGADLNSPASTVELLRLKAVVGLIGRFRDDSLVGVGVACALCHSTVDNSVAPGIGKRLDGWANRDLDPGRILSLSPALQDPAVQAVLTSWGPGRYDPRWNIDGINGPVLIPPAYGLRRVPLETYTGDGPVSYWNSYVAVTQMHGQGSFSDPRIGVSVTQSPDLVTPKLGILLKYQLSLSKPAIDPRTFDASAARRGKKLFKGKANCGSCHISPTYTDAGITLHEPSEVGQDPQYAQRTATKKYRTTPLRGLASHPPYFHDGSAATLGEVVDHYTSLNNLDLSESEKTDLVEFLKSL